MNNNIDFKRLSYLGERLRSGLATKEERDEYMFILYSNGSINAEQYNNYKNGTNKGSDDIINAALAVGAILLVGYLLSELFKSK